MLSRRERYEALVAKRNDGTLLPLPATGIGEMPIRSGDKFSDAGDELLQASVHGAARVLAPSVEAFVRGRRATTRVTPLASLSPDPAIVAFMSEAQMRACIDAYVAAWNEHDAVKRRALLEQACASGLRFVARGAELVGREKLDAFMEDFQRRRPDTRAVFSSVVEIQHHAFRYTGKAEAPAVPPLPEALEVGECDDDGRIRLILSFVGAAPPRA